MNLKQQNILFITRTMKVGGTENVILQLCEILKPLTNKIIVCSCGGINVKKLDKMGIKHYQIPDITHKSPKAMMEICYSLKKIIREENITVIHSHHRMAALYAQMVSNKSIVKIANAHNTFNDKRILTKIAYRNTYLIAVGENVQKNLMNYFGIYPKQIKVIYNAVDSFTDKIEPLKTLEDARKQGYILVGNVGRLSEQKGMTYFIEAAAMVYEKYTNVRFYIIGDGEDYNQLEILANKLLPDNVIKFLGYRSDVQNIMTQLDYIVLSSLWEGLPLTPIEAFSVKKPVVATAVDGTVEIVKNGYNGLLVKEKKSVELANAMLELCIDDEKRHNMAIKAYDTYVNNFSMETFRMEYVKFYEKLEL